MLSIFSRLFGKKAPKEPIRDIHELVASIASPGAHLVVQDEPALSHFGGSPCLPADIPWPEHNGRLLDFLARLSLAELHGAFEIPWLPTAGALLFFYDLEEQPWGFDPKDRGSCRVLHVPDLSESVPPPEGDANDSKSPIPLRYIGFRRIDTLPSSERDSVHALGLSDQEMDAYFEMCDLPYLGMPKHQVGGFPAPVQGDAMELECQLASNGLYCGNSSGYSDLRAAELAPGAQDWRLLFQLDTDEDLGVMWCDCGTLYFWVQEQEARNGNFADAWLILQCC